MTASKLLLNALILLGYADNNDGIPQDVRQIALTVINCVLSDICHIAGVEFKTVESLLTEILLEEKYSDIAVYGIASFIAANKCDTARQQYFGTLYNNRRKLLTRLENIADNMP